MKIKIKNIGKKNEEPSGFLIFSGMKSNQIKEKIDNKNIVVAIIKETSCFFVIFPSPSTPK